MGERITCLNLVNPVNSIYGEVYGPALRIGYAVQCQAGVIRFITRHGILVGARTAKTHVHHAARILVS